MLLLKIAIIYYISISGIVQDILFPGITESLIAATCLSVKGDPRL